MSFLRPLTRSAREGVGRPVLRKDDARLLVGAGCYSDDVNLPGQAYACFVRSPHAHADVGPIANILFWVILYHAFFAALDLKTVDGGSYPAGLHTFVIMVWIAVGVQWFTNAIMPGLFGGLVN